MRILRGSTDTRIPNETNCPLRIGAGSPLLCSAHAPMHAHVRRGAPTFHWHRERRSSGWWTRWRVGRRTSTWTRADGRFPAGWMDDVQRAILVPGISLVRIPKCHHGIPTPAMPHDRVPYEAHPLARIRRVRVAHSIVIAHHPDLTSPSGSRRERSVAGRPAGRP